MEYTNSNPSPVKEYILSVLAKNRSGVLLRIAGLFSRRCYNILSIVAAQTENTEYSRILLVVSGDDRIVRQVDKQIPSWWTLCRWTCWTGRRLWCGSICC